MACSTCGKSSRSTSRSTTAPSLMRSGNKIFSFGPYGKKVSKTVVGRVKPSSLKTKKR
jgi:hypothetical protein